jgi:dCMP deaminase
MFVGIAGPPCSGKRTIAKWLIVNHGFTYVSFKPLVLDGLRFDSAGDLLLHVTERWTENFVTCDVDESFRFSTNLWEAQGRAIFFFLRKSCVGEIWPEALRAL